MTMSRTKILWLVILFLLTTNIVTVISGYKYASKAEEPVPENNIVPLGQRVNFFRDQLDLSVEQRSQFLEFSRNFNREAGKITESIEVSRYRMIDEMAKETTDYKKLEEICNEIGDLHRKLKESTITYYMHLKEICNEEQREKLHGLFRTMANPDGDINTFVRGRGLHRGRNGRGGPGQYGQSQFENSINK